MSHAYEDEVRQALLEAFTAGWQAGLAVTITNPRVLAVVESCFDLWLLEAADEVEVFGLSFRRVDLPVPSRVELLASSARAGVATIPALPTQRRSPEDGGGAPSAGPQRRASAGALDLRRRLARTIGRVGGGRHRQVATRD